MKVGASIEVLLVEDDPTAVLIARDQLDDFRQFNLRYAERLSTALDFLADADIDVVLLDLGLPDSQGLETLLSVRAGSPYVPIVVMTSRDDEELAVQAVQSGAQDYLAKSHVQHGTLKRAIIYAIERNEAATALRESAVIATAISDAGFALSRGGPLGSTLAYCADLIRSRLDASLVGIWTLDSGSGEFVLLASGGAGGWPERMQQGALLQDSALGHVAKKREAIVSSELPPDLCSSDPEWSGMFEGATFAAYPLLVEDRLVGVLSVISRQGFSSMQISALTTLANQIAVGIERKCTEDALQNANRTLESLLEAAPLAIVVTDRDAKIVRWNRAAVSLFGWMEDEILGRTHPLLREIGAVESITATSAETDARSVLGTELKLSRKDGHSIDAAVWTAHVRDDFGNIVASMNLVSDQSDRLQLEEKFRHSQKMEAVGSLAGGVAHDFNNILTIIEGNNDLLSRNLSGDSTLREYVGEVHQAVLRAASLTRQLLAFSRKQVLEPKILDLNELVANLEKLLVRLIGEDVSLSCVLGLKLGSVMADAGQIEQVLMNLAVNARDAMPLGGKLTIETRNVELDVSYTCAYSDLQPGRFVLLAVSDTGTGMDEATKARIFEPFFTTKAVGKGTGLGLATIYGIVKQSGGHVAVYSELNRGSTFKVYLPRVDDSFMHDAHEKASMHSVAVEGSETILLAEDESSVRLLTCRVLEQHGYRVLEARDGADALRVAAEFEGRIDLLITDVVMPVISGSELAEQLVRIRSGIRVLYLSGYTDDAVVRHGVIHSEMSFLQKPFSPDGLARKVREVLDRPDES